jgi:cytochrome b561
LLKIKKEDLMIVLNFLAHLGRPIMAITGLAKERATVEAMALHVVAGIITFVVMMWALVWLLVHVSISIVLS